MYSKERIDNALKRFQYSGIQWEELPLQLRETFRKSAKKIKLKKKEVLFRMGSYPRGLFILRTGKLKVYQVSYDGSLQILFVYATGEIFGYRPILSSENQPVSIAALEDSTLFFIDRKKFLDVLVKSHELSNMLLISLSHEFTVLTNRINVFAQRGVKERLALVLLVLNEKFKIGDEDVADIKITRTDLANFVGTSLETLVRTMNYFKAKRLVRTRGRSIFIEHFENLFILSAIE
jgi:CRP-like cAMP-binding protein